jgi:dTDP-4-dehydrorhamnose reductase
MRILVTGREGQVATALAEAGPAAGVTVITCGRPELDLEKPETIAPVIESHKPDVVVNAAAWTAVDQAEAEPERCHAVNAAGAGHVAAAARRAGAPVIQISTDYVFAGDLDRAYREDDPTGPTGVYGASKLAGERAVAAASPDHAILRTAWVYAPIGKNFVRTMLRLAESRDEVGVVADQFGAPTYAPDIAAATLDVARLLLARRDATDQRGIFHLAASGETASWADFAEAIFAGAARRGAKPAAVRRIGTSDYPTPARRPANSRLDCNLLASVYGVRLPDWRDGLERCLDRLIGPIEA